MPKLQELALLKAVPITPKAYAPYGDVIAAAGRGVAANQGTAGRYNWLVPLENARPQAKPNFCVFRCQPRKERPFPVKLLEKHPDSTQVFIPMSGAGRALIIVANGNSEPDLSTMAAFLVEGPIGISYNHGVWHHPMVSLDKVSDFASLVWENGTAGDCAVKTLHSPVSVDIPRR